MTDKTLKKEIMNYMSKNVDAKKNYKSVSKKVEFDDKNKKKAPVFKITLTFAVVLIICCIVAVVALQGGGESNPTKNVLSRVTVDVNPSVELLLDEDNKVVSVTGLNDDGMIVICGEKITGKSLEDALKVIVSVETETGYLLSGDVEASENEISISVTADTEALASTVKEICNKSIKAVSESLNLEYALDFTSSLAHAGLVELALVADPTLTKEKATEMTTQELLTVLAEFRKEIKDFYSQELVDLYVASRDHQIIIANTEFTNSVISGLDSTYQAIKAEYSDLVEGLKDAQNGLDELRYTLLVKEDSTYQKALLAVKEAKKQVLDLQKEMAEEESSLVIVSIQAQLRAKELLLDAALLTLETVKDGIDLSISTAQAALEVVITNLEAFEAELPEEIKTSLESHATELEKKLNNTKNAFYKNFEDSYQATIDAAKKACDNLKKTNE